MDTLHSITRRLFLKSAPVAAAAAALPAAVAAMPVDTEAHAGRFPDSLSHMVIDGKTCLIDTSDYLFDGYAEAAVVRWDGQISIDQVANYDGHRFGGERCGMRQLPIRPGCPNIEAGEGCIILGRLVEVVAP